MFNFLLDTAAQEPGFWGKYGSIFMLVAIIVLFYFILIRPQRKQAKAADAMRDAVQVGDEITTIGGIVGVIVSIKGETIVLETTKNRTHIRFLKSAIRSVDVRAEETVKPLKTHDDKPAKNDGDIVKPAKPEDVIMEVSEAEEIVTTEDTEDKK